MHAKRKRIVLASKRLPVTIVQRAARPVLVRSGGGLATALRELHARSDSSWVGWLGDTATSDASVAHEIDQQARADRLTPVPLGTTSRPFVDECYSNNVLWPLFHYLLDKVRLDASDQWRAYVELNECFAHAIASETSPQDSVWIHDYQLALVPALLRKLVAGVRIGFFLHVPWPAADVYRILPSRRQLLEGVLGADLVGFQTLNDRKNFMGCAAEVLGAHVAESSIRCDDREVRAGVYPIGLDVGRFAQRSLAIEETVTMMREGSLGKVIVLGVDRLDYTKGIAQRLSAVDHLLETEPELRHRLHYIQLAVPTREHIDAYGELRRRVNEQVARINSRHGSPMSCPVQLLYRSVPFEQLVALYRAADVMLVTPLRDGMNLVAKEYIASRTDNLGCLILSEFAGAASQLDGALRVNPYDVSALAATVRRAMFMPQLEQRKRMMKLRRLVAEQSVYKWADDFLNDLSQPQALYRASADAE